jgi:hypothetical protein
MAGFPQETMSDLRATAAFFVNSLRYDHADPQLSILAPLADTPIQKQHKDWLVLDDDLADLSYRGWQQEPEDQAMIAAHPDIFSSFYSVPTPHLEREFVKELRDFLLTGMRTFRRLLLGLEQDSGDVVTVFQRWRQWRAANGVRFSNGDRTAYYAHGSFAADFLGFVELDYIPNASQAPLAITALMEYEAALLGDRLESDREQVSDDDEELLSPDSRPQLLPGVRVVELPADYQEIVLRLRRKSSLHDILARPVKLAIRSIAAGPAEVRQLTPLSAELLDLCEGSLTVEEIAAEFRKNGKEVSGVPADKLCLAGIEILRQQRLVGLISAAQKP